MPTYVYKCQRCGNQFEMAQPMTAQPLKVHESCGGEVRRMIQPAPVIFNGSGFYITDSRKSTDSPKSQPKDRKKSKAGPSSD
ncbi:MAG: hypothetical protein HY335_05250 [Deinococcus sp.]|nr:hypothetical protein [Deinococcus sp.]